MLIQMHCMYSLSFWLEFGDTVPTHELLCWRISAHVFLVDLWIAAS